MAAAAVGAAVWLVVLVSTAMAEEEDNSTTAPYVAPEVDGLHWAETFDGDVWSRWSPSAQEKYNGKFSVAARNQEALTGDLGLLIPDEARHYGAAAKFPQIVGKKEAPFVVQFEVKFQDGLSCGGSYIKLFNSDGVESFKDDTPYVIMFGPDRCGSTDKVHFILQHKSPKTGKWEEKHCKDVPSVPSDSLSHLYGLIINPDNSWEIQIDGEKKTSGSLLTSMEPPVNPPKDIDDPTDSKPEDWVDEAKMDDPDSSKPDDWDEDAPMMIPDPAASKPSGWVDDAPAKIDDPSAVKPEDWDDDEDGEWEAPIIDNPVCSVGCGKWEAPKISNPEYKGKWYAPKIDNPEYKGVWKPRQIPNPDYFVDEEPCILPAIDSVGIDIWTMSKGIIFDNIVISADVGKAKAFADASFKLRHELELKQQPKPSRGGLLEDAMDFASRNMAAVGVTAAALLLASIWCCCIRGGGAPRAPTPEEKKQARLKKKAEAEKKAKEEGEEEEESKAKEAEGEEEEEEKKDEEPAEEKKEGGLGDIDEDDK